MPRERLHSRRRWPAATVLALTLALAGAACAGRYGAARWDVEAGRSFTAGQVLPGHRYYTAGPELAPEAILALREGRPLRSRLWREVPSTPATLALLVDRMRGTRDVGPHAYAVADDRGERIGVWFSFLGPTPVLLLDDGGVDMAPPLTSFDDGPLRGPWRARD